MSEFSSLKLAAMMRRCVAIVIISVFLAPAFAAAKPLTLNFTGAWIHHDNPYETPEFHDAMASVGVVNGTPIFWSLVVDDVDLDPNPLFSNYTVLGAEVTFGMLALSYGPSPGSTGLEGHLWIDPTQNDWATIYTQPFGAAVAGYVPTYLQLLSFGGPTFTTPLGSLTGPNLLIGFSPDGAGLYLGETQLTYVNAVPEPEIYAMMGVGLGVLGFLRRRQGRSG